MILTIRKDCHGILLCMSERKKERERVREKERE